MPKAQNVKGIVLHCSAGFGDIESMKKFWFNTLGWKTVGYHIVIDLNGQINQLQPFSATTNGVEGHNSEYIHICYIGGVEKAGVDKKGQVIWRGKDTRTEKQILAQHKAITMAMDWLKASGKNVTKDFAIVGHRDFSKDQNGDGIIASWERIKECPSFDAMREFDYYTSKDRKGLLPTIKSFVQKSQFLIHVVVKGDTLSKIAKAYKTTVEDIKKLNSLSSDIIQIGLKLKV